MLNPGLKTMLDPFLTNLSHMYRLQYSDLKKDLEKS